MVGVDDRANREAVFRSFLKALGRRDLTRLEMLASEHIELRSVAVGSAHVRDRTAMLEAVRVNSRKIYDPALSRFRHLDDGYMIVSGRVRYSVDGGGFADSSKVALVRVCDGKVELSLTCATLQEAEAEHLSRKPTVAC